MAFSDKRIGIDNAVGALLEWPRLQSSPRAIFFLEV